MYTYCLKVYNLRRYFDIASLVPMPNKCANFQITFLGLNKMLTVVVGKFKFSALET